MSGNGQDANAGDFLLLRQGESKLGLPTSAMQHSTLALTWYMDVQPNAPDCCLVCH